MDPPFPPGGTYPQFMSMEDAEASRRGNVLEFRPERLDSSWCQKINMDALSDGRVSVEAEDGVTLHFSVSVSPGSGVFQDTKFITAQPMYWFVNQSSHHLDFRQYQADHIFNLASGQEVPFYWSSSTLTTRNPGLVVRLAALEGSGVFNEWSSSFQLDDTGDYHIRLLEKAPGAVAAARFFDIEIFLRNGSQYVVFRDGEPPFELENLSQHVICVRQEDSGPQDIVLLRPGVRVPFTWTSPSGPYRLQAAIRTPKEAGKEWKVSRLYDIRTIGLKPTLTASTEDSSGTVLLHFIAVEVCGNGPTRVIKFSDSTEASQRPDLGNEDQPDVGLGGFDFLPDPNERRGLEIHLNVPDFGISIVDGEPREICYLSCQGLQLDFSDSPKLRKVRLVVQDLQVDNQLPKAKWTCALFRSPGSDAGSGVGGGGSSRTVSPSPSSTTLQAASSSTLPGPPKPLLQVAFVGSNTTTSMDVVPSMQVLLQEFSLKVDERLLFRLLVLFHGGSDEGTSGEREVDAEAAGDLLRPVSLKEELSKSSLRRLYVGLLILNAVKIHISISTVGIFDTFLQKRMAENLPMGVSVNFLRSTLGNFIGNLDGAVFRLNALVIENVFTSRYLFSKLVMEHYKNQAMGQVLSIVGASDVLGNPSGLFRNIGTGVKDFFVEPARFDSASKLSGAWGKGLSRVATDTTFQQSLAHENAPESFEEGVMRGFSGLGRGLTEGLTGLVTQPLKGAEKGMGGLIGGIGKGLVGVFAKPAAGFLDLTHNVTAGAKTSFKARDPMRRRHPRFVPSSGRVLPFDSVAAYGAHVFEVIKAELGYSEAERYFGHVVLDPEPPQRTCVVTTARLMLVQLGSFQEGVLLTPLDFFLLDIPLSRLETYEVVKGGLRLQERDKDAYILKCQSEATARHLHGLILSVVEQGFKEGN